MFDASTEGLEATVNEKITENKRLIEVSLEKFEKETASKIVDIRSEISDLESKTCDDQAKLAGHLQKDLEDSNQRADRVLLDSPKTLQLIFL